MSRGKGARSKIVGRKSGYETADFTIVNSPLNNTDNVSKSQDRFSIHEKNKMSLPKKIVLILGSILTLFFIIGGITHFINEYTLDNSYEEPKVITPESAKVKPTAFTQRQLDAQYERDKKIGDVLKDGWINSDNEVPSDNYVTVGKKWESTRGNPSSLINVITSYEYEPKDQKYENCSISLTLQEVNEYSGITIDSTVANILKIYSPEINIDSLNSSVQAAYTATLNSKPYQGSLSFDKDYVNINGSKSGRLISITIDVNTYINNN